MDERDFVNAIVDAPEEDGPRLAFADWLEANGKQGRARYIRAYCERDYLRTTDPGYLKAYFRLSSTYDRCHPPWGRDLPPSGITLSNGRGLIRIMVGSKTALNRLGKLPWLRPAIDRGWLSGISLTVKDESVVQALAACRGPVREIPLHLILDRPISTEGMAIIREIPRLIGLELGAGTLQFAFDHRLHERPELRGLWLGLEANHRGFYDTPEVVVDVMDRVARLDRLTSLRLAGPRPSPGDPAFLSKLSGMAGLKTLTLFRWPDLTVEALGRLEPLIGLRRLNLIWCPGWTDEEMRPVADALPDVRIHRAGRP